MMIKASCVLRDIAERRPEQHICTDASNGSCPQYFGQMLQTVCSFREVASLIRGSWCLTSKGDFGRRSELYIFLQDLE